MIGILDSGIGGLSVYAEIVRLMPYEGVFYYADTAHCPYGGRSEEEILSLSRECVRALVDGGCEVVVIACNTITSVAAEVLRREFFGIDIIGMEPAIKPAARLSRSRVVGVLATKATLAADKYHNTRDAFAGGVKVVEIVGEGLVECVEQGRVNSVECEDLVRGYVDVLHREGADSVVLGCTHYPFLRHVIEKVGKGRFVGAMGEDTITVIDPAPAVARRVREVVESRKVSGGWDNRGGEEIFYSSKEGESVSVEELAKMIRKKVESEI